MGRVITERHPERPPLDVRGLNRALVDGGLWRAVRVLDETGSTNADVAELARSGEPEGLVLVAEYQNAGRGRLGRTWTAPPRSGLSFSILLRPDDVPVATWTLLPLLVGVAVAEAVTAVAPDVPVGLKWPNDLLVGDRKLAGILAERVDSPVGPAVVVGIGLNVSLNEHELPLPTATSLAIAGAGHIDRDIVLRAVLSAIAHSYIAWRAGSGDGVRVLAAYRELCVTLGRDVRVELGGDQIVGGRAVEIGSDGSLVVETPAGRRSVSAGDVVHVR
ncbi:MAG: BirA family transcriptional regulator [Actinomycetota bacterium]|nr:BirA family transcriptional regulator [Actinomycetota bacterium]